MKRTRETVATSENFRIIPAGRNWTIKHMLKDGLPATWNTNELGLTVVEHKYSHTGSGGYYNVWIKTDPRGPNRVWLVWEVQIPEAVKKEVREVLQSYGLKWNRVCVLEKFAKWVSDAYGMLGQRVVWDNRREGKSHPFSITNAGLDSMYTRITTNAFYPLYKSEFDELAAEQYEDYYKHVRGGGEQ